MKKQLLFGAMLLGSVFMGSAQVTIPFEGFSQDGAYFTMIADVGELEGTLTSVGFNITLDASTGGTYANDISVVIATGLGEGDTVVLQAGGASNFGAAEHLEFEGGTSDAPGTTLMETLTLANPVTLTGSNYKVYMGNGFLGENPNSGTWSGTITLNGVTEAAAGVNDVFASKFSVYPNPANDVITIANAENMLVNGVTVTDLNGRTVKTVIYNGVSEAQINISDLASGLYMVTVSSDKGTATKKIIKN